jgi:hypothetical protein
VNRPHYARKRISNYDFFKSLDETHEKLANGELKPPREHARDYLCPLCSTRKRSLSLVPSRVMGVPVRELTLIKTDVNFKGRFILCCEDCARPIRAAKVA